MNYYYLLFCALLLLISTCLVIPPSLYSVHFFSTSSFSYSIPVVTCHSPFPLRFPLPLSILSFPSLSLSLPFPLPFSHPFPFFPSSLLFPSLIFSLPYPPLFPSLYVVTSHSLLSPQTHCKHYIFLFQSHGWTITFFKTFPYRLTNHSNYFLYFPQHPFHCFIISILLRTTFNFFHSSLVVILILSSTILSSPVLFSPFHSLPQHLFHGVIIVKYIITSNIQFLSLFPRSLHHSCLLHSLFTFLLLCTTPIMSNIQFLSFFPSGPQHSSPHYSLFTDSPSFTCSITSLTSWHLLCFLYLTFILSFLKQLTINIIQFHSILPTKLFHSFRSLHLISYLTLPVATWSPSPVPLHLGSSFIN